MGLGLKPNLNIARKMWMLEKIKYFLRKIYPDKSKKPQLLKLLWATMLDFGWIFLIEWLVSIVNQSEYIGITKLFSNDEVEVVAAKAAMASRTKVFIGFFFLELMIWLGIRSDRIRKNKAASGK